MKLAEAVEKLDICDKEVPENTVDLIPVTSKIKGWAAENGLTLAFLSVMFVITWVVDIISGS